jgi:hypothetical protein
MSSSQPLSVDFFMIAHDPFDGGKLRISTELLGCGLVGAQLAELILGHRLTVNGELLSILDMNGRRDVLEDYVLEHVANQGTEHPVRAWIEPLQDGVYALIGDQLVAGGTLGRQPGPRRIGRGGRQPDRFPANDLLVACRPQQQLERLLRLPKDLTLPMGTLAVLIDSLGLDGLLDPALDRSRLHELLAEVEQNLPAELQAVSVAIRTIAGEVSLRAR